MEADAARKRSGSSADSVDRLAQTTEVAKENMLLRKELQRTTMERDILKKALSARRPVLSAKRTKDHLPDDTEIIFRFSGSDALSITRGKHYGILSLL